MKPDYETLKEMLQEMWNHAWCDDEAGTVVVPQTEWIKAGFLIPDTQSMFSQYLDAVERAEDD